MNNIEKFLETNDLVDKIISEYFLNEKTNVDIFKEDLLSKNHPIIKQIRENRQRIMKIASNKNIDSQKEVVRLAEENIKLCNELKKDVNKLNDNDTFEDKYFLITQKIFNINMKSFQKKFKTFKEFYLAFCDSNKSDYIRIKKRSSGFIEILEKDPKGLSKILKDSNSQRAYNFKNAYKWVEKEEDYL